MTKRITALFIAVLIPLTLILTGCGNQPAETVVDVTPVEFAPEGVQLTVGEYRETLMNLMKDYVVVLNDVPLDEENDTVAKLKPHWGEAKESCRKCNEKLDMFGTINPPEKLVEKHKKLLEGVNNEKEYVAAMERFLTAKNNKDLKRYSEELEKLVDRPTEETLAGMFSELSKELKEATDTVTSQL
ncbi:MAG: hypothetical protein K2J80_01450 [Oscillospiraceae bacterium]|nr:hypothetical protein [Oscillospiraceae bacterium]